MDPDNQSAIFAAIYKALHSEGFDKNDAYRIANRGAKLLTEPDKPVPAHAHAPDESRRTAFPHSAAAALDSSPGDLVRKIGWLTERLSAKFDFLNTLLSLIAVTIFGGFIFVTLVLILIVKRLAVE